MVYECFLGLGHWGLEYRFFFYGWVQKFWVGGWRRKGGEIRKGLVASFSEGGLEGV
jgi:hypothetical protein